MTKSHPPSTFDIVPLFREVREVLESARSSVFRTINVTMLRAYWQVGRLIFEHEQKGQKRAAYGEALLERLAQKLAVEFGRGFDVTNLRKMRQFYRMFQIRDAVRLELSWSHYRLLMQVGNRKAREWYMREAVEQRWSTRQLERQISVLYFERLLASQHKAKVRKEALKKLAPLGAEQFIRDPYVLEFIDIKSSPAWRESRLEQAIISNLQSFLLELGKGFSFVARQKRMRFGEEDFYVDLVFYNYFLKCFVLVDLKVGKLTHQDVGQMESYVRMFDAQDRPPKDNPTIGLILCSSKNEAIAKYSVLNDRRQIFAAKYVKVLPTEGELRREIERERHLIDIRSDE